MPRRYHNYPTEFQVWHIMSSAGASVLAVGVLIPAVYFLWALKYGPRAGANPWGAAGLEWMTQSPPIKDNFDEPPVVTWEAYNYDEMTESEAQRDREIMPGAEEAAKQEASRDAEQAESPAV
jgi:cytochrome c oxidase subunit 1